MKIDTKISVIFDILNGRTGGKITFLEAENSFQLLIGVILSAQTTDRQVNEILPGLFRKYPNAGALGNAEISEVSALIRSVGFYNTKAANIIKTAAVIHDQHNDEVPADMKVLLSLPGVGRKSANVIRGACFGKPAIIADTHFMRTVRRLGLTDEKTPDKIEADLSVKIPPEIQYRFSMLLNKHGREYCRARSPQCEICPIREVCEWKPQQPCGG